MGLTERRKIRELQEVTFPARVKEIEQICGVAISYEVDWEGMADNAAALNFIDNISCHRLNMALRSIAVDEMGRSAFRDGLKLVRLKNVPDPGQMEISFTGGVLEMRCAYAHGADGLFNDNAIREVLIRGL